MKTILTLIFIFLNCLGYSQKQNLIKNSISIYNQIIDTTSSNKPINIGVEFSFNNSNELSNFLDKVLDTCKMVILVYDSVMFIPDNFFKLSKLQYVHINARFISSVDKRFGSLINLKMLEVVCDTLLDVSRNISGLTMLEGLDLSVKMNYSKKLKRKIRQIVRCSESKELHAAIGSYHCWKKENRRCVNCKD